MSEGKSKACCITPRKSCADYNKPVASGYPITLYHATINKHSVCEKGLLPSCKVGASGLGQLTSDCDTTISFTPDKILAMEIAKDLRTYVNIANGTYNAHNIAEKLDDVDIEGKFFDFGGELYRHDINDTPSNIWKRTVSDPDMDLLLKRAIQREAKQKPWTRFTPETIESMKPSLQREATTAKFKFASLKKGLVENHYSENLQRTEDYDSERLTLGEYRKKYNDPRATTCFAYEGEHDYNQDLDEGTVLRHANGTKDEQQRVLFRLWRDNYLPVRQYLKGRHDPWFSITLKPSDIKHLKEDDVGLFQVSAYFPHKNFRGRDDVFVRSKRSKQKNDFEIENNEAISYKGEKINKEIKIGRDRFTKLKEIPFLDVEIPAKRFDG